MGIEYTERDGSILTGWTALVGWSVLYLLKGAAFLVVILMTYLLLRLAITGCIGDLCS